MTPETNAPDCTALPQTPPAAPWRSLREGDPWAYAILMLGLLWTAFISQGLPYWDVDFTNFFSVTLNRSLGQLVGDLLSPVSRDPENWGFMDRVVQMLVYKISYSIAGYNSWPYLLFRCFSYGFLAFFTYVWSLRLVPGSSSGRRAAFAAATFFVIAPGPTAALVWLGDIAVTAEALFLYLTFVIWDEIERTPPEWTSFLRIPADRRARWAGKWLLLVFLVYIGYKTKADLKLIPVIMGSYVLLLRRGQWKTFLLPVAGMLIMAAPWNPEVFRKPPPFMPGAQGSSTSWMFQGAKIGHVAQFLWSGQPYSIKETFHSAGTTSLAGLLGPFLLTGIAAFLIWRFSRGDQFNPLAHETPADRARIFVMLWAGAMIAATSALPQINEFFQIRYTILTLLPVSLLLAWIFGQFALEVPDLPGWALAAGLALLLFQDASSLCRSIVHRSELGGVTIAVDQTYNYIDHNFPDDELALLPGVLPYDYHADSVVIHRRDPLSQISDITRHRPGHTVVIGWEPASQPQLPLIRSFTGCGDAFLFNAAARFLDPCDAKKIAVMRYTSPLREQPAQATEAAAQNLLNRSVDACNSHKAKECADFARQATELNPDFAEAFNNLAVGEALQGHWDQAIAAAETAIRLKPDFQLAKNNLAWAQSEKAKQK